MTPEELVSQLESSKAFFDRSTGCLIEADAGFTPIDGAMTTAQQLAHIAQTVEWFVEGAFGEGFDMDFPSHMKNVLKTESLVDGRAWCGRAYAKAIDVIGSKSPEEVLDLIPDGPIMGNQPKLAIVAGILDHTAHHRGALTVYARLRGHTPDMPYI